MFLPTLTIIIIAVATDYNVAYLNPVTFAALLAVKKKGWKIKGSRQDSNRCAFDIARKSQSLTTTPSGQ